MKTIGLLGGTGWGSTIGYYRLLNELVQERLGGFHSAKLLLKSIDYHEIKMHYYTNHGKVAELLRVELEGLFALKPDCVMICCNSLHKFYDMIAGQLNSEIPVMHAVDLVKEHVQQGGYKKVLLLATRLTMEDGFYAKKLEYGDVEVVVPGKNEREQIQKFLDHLIQYPVTDVIRNYFQDLIQQYKDLDAVILGCTELPLAIDKTNSVLPIINPVQLQAHAAVEFALG